MLIPRGDQIMNQSPKSAGLKLALFGVATLVWLAAAIYLGYTARNPDTSCVGTFSCLTASEWGDFLAGVFAPIAFLWLVAAVWIQSDELREQRVELVLTRKEFELNRLVMIQQAEEARKQAEYIEAQTKILVEEANFRRKNEALDSFNALISRFISYITENHDASNYTSNGVKYSLFGSISSKLSTEKCVYEQNKWMSIVVEHARVDIIIGDADLFERMFMTVYSAEELLDKIPYHSRVTWQRSMLHELVEKYSKIILSSDQFSHLRGHVEARECRLARRTDTFDISSLAPDA